MLPTKVLLLLEANEIELDFQGLFCYGNVLGHAALTLNVRKINLFLSPQDL